MWFKPVFATVKIHSSVERVVISLPRNEPALLRTEFDSEESWRSFEPQAAAHVMIVNDSAYAGMSLADLMDLAGTSPPKFLFVADADTLEDPEHPILVIGFDGDDGGAVSTFRVAINQFATVADNLSLANLDFDDFVSATDDDLVFRGFPPPPAQREVLFTDIVSAARDRTSTAALSQFYDFLVDRPRQWTKWKIIDVPDLTTLHASTAAQYSEQTSVVLGLADFLETARQGGPGSTILLPARGGFWAAILNSDTFAPQAAMRTR